MSKSKLFASIPRKLSIVALTKRSVGIVIPTCIGLLSAASPAAAHHALSGKLPANFFEGFMSGLAHPIIGIDHFVFVVAIGLLCARQPNKFRIPAAFVLAAMSGTGIHLLGLDLPGAEIVISASVIAIGAMLVVAKTTNGIVIAGLGAIAGLFHGYAYGESIVGAQMSPLVAYLVGFSLIQYGVAIAALLICEVVSQKFASQVSGVMRLAGLVICSTGVVFLTKSLIS